MIEKGQNINLGFNHHLNVNRGYFYNGTPKIGNYSALFRTILISRVTEALRF